MRAKNISSSLLLDKVTTFLFVRRYWLMGLCSLALVFSMSGITKLNFSGDFNTMFDSNNPNLRQLQMIQHSFDEGEKIVVLLKTSRGTILEPENLVALQAIHNELWQMPYAISVNSLINYEHLEVEGDELKFVRLLPNPQEITSQQLELITQQHQSDDAVIKALLSDDAVVTSAIVRIALPNNPASRIPAIKEQEDYFAKLTKDLAHQYPTMEIHHIGASTLEWTLLSVVAGDAIKLFPICIGLCLLVLGMLLRSTLAVAATIFTIVTSVFGTMGLAGWLGYELSPLSLSAPTMVLLLAMADSIHLMSQHVLELQKGYNKYEAMQNSLRSNLKPIALTSIATAIGFLSMNFSDSPGFHDFANITALGVMIAFIVTLFLIPGLVLLFSSSKPQNSLQSKRWMSILGLFVINNRRALFFGILLCSPLIILQIKNLQVNDDVIDYLSDDLPFKQSVQMANQHNFGFHHIIFSLDTKTLNGINEPEFLDSVDHFTRWLMEQPGVINTQSFVDVIKNINNVMKPRPEGNQSIPDSRALVSQYSLLYELALPNGAELNSLFNTDRSALRLVVSLSALPNDQLLNLNDAALDWLNKNAPHLSVNSGSQALLFANIGEIIFQSMIVGTIVALVCIISLIIVGIRSVRFGLLSILPNIIPPCLVFGLWSLVFGEVNQTAAIIFSVSLGLVVDDSIHFLTKYLHGREQGLTAEDSIIRCFESVGVALFVTSTALCVGLFTLLFSSFIPNITTALMLSWIVAIALAFDLFFLPPLLLYFEKVFPYAPRDESHENSAQLNLTAAGRAEGSI